MADEQKTLIDITALKYFYKSLQNVTVLIAPSSIDSASSENLGRTYFIQTDGTYAGIACKKGDHIVSNGTSWVLIPKGTSEGGTTYYAGDGIDISTVDGKDTIANTGVLAIEEADDTNKGTVKVTTKDGSDYVPVHGLGTAAYADVTDTYDEDGTAPVSGKAVKSAISGKLDASEKGANGGVAELDEHGIILSSQLPSYVDDVIEASSKSAFPATGESGKIYVDTTTNLSYRWAGTDYVEISPSIALGETPSTAFRGDHGKTAYDHATTTETNPHGTTKADVDLGNVGNFKAVSTVASQGLTDTEKSNARANIGLGSVAVKGVETTITSTNNNVPTSNAVKTELDKKVQKTTVVRDPASGETEISTRTVPAGCTAAMVAKIKGKTVKLNLFDMDEFIKVDPTNITKVNDKSFQIKGAWYKDIGITLKASTKYTLSIKVVSSNVQSAVIIVDSSGTPIMSESLKDTGSVTVTTTSGTGYKIRIYSGNATSGTSVYSDVQLEEGTVAHPYAPFGLISAPVESVVSQGVNLFDYKAFVAEDPSKRKITGENEFSVTGTYMQAGTIKLKPNTKYTILKTSISSTVNVGMIIREVGSSTNLVAQYADGYNTFTTTSATEYTLGFYSGNATSGTTVYKNIMIYEGTATMSHVPYNKTTVLVPSSVKNLPDYGLGIVKSDGTIVANEVDFENGVYHHRVGKWKPAPTIWAAGGSATAPTHVYTDVPSDAKKVTDYLWICNMYSQVTNTWWNTNASTRDKVFASGNSGGSVQLVDRSCTTLDQYKTKLANVEFVYELASDDVKPLTDYIRPVTCEAGGTITLVNPHNLDVANVVKYKKEV